MRTAVLLPLLALLAVAQAVSFADVIKEEWHTFKVSFPGLSMDLSPQEMGVQQVFSRNKGISMINALFLGLCLGQTLFA